MTTYMTTVEKTNVFGGPFSKLWEIAKWVDEHDYGPDEWEFSPSTRTKLRDRSYGKSPTELKRRIDDGEIDYPCGAREFSTDPDDVNATAFLDGTVDGVVELDVTVECEQCGYTHSANTLVTPEP